MVLSLVLYATLALAVVGAGLYAVGAYNQMVTSAKEVERAFANVEVCLKQRHDELPRLVETCRGYMPHERQLLERVVRLRNDFAHATDIDGKVAAENVLDKDVSRLVSLAEAYPELKASELFQGLMKRLTDLEDLIADRREHFNAAVMLYNIYVESFPVLVLASLLGHRPHAQLDLDVRQRAEQVAFAR